MLTFSTMIEDKIWHFWTTYPPHLVNVAKERPPQAHLGQIAANNRKERKFDNCVDFYVSPCKQWHNRVKVNLNSYMEIYKPVIWQDFFFHITALQTECRLHKYCKIGDPDIGY